MDDLFTTENLSIIGHLTYTLVFFSFLVRSIFWLRVLSIFASSASILYNYYIAGDPLWVPIQWNAIFFLTNIVHIIIILMERRNFVLEGYEAYIHDEFFKELTSSEFKKFTKDGYLRTAQNKEVLIEQHHSVDSLIIIYSGNVEILSHGEKVLDLSSGHFVGEMSFLTGEPATAEVRCLGEVKYFFWGKESLKKLVLKKPKLMMALQKALSHQLIDYILKDKQKSDNR